MNTFKSLALVTLITFQSVVTFAERIQTVAPPAETSNPGYKMGMGLGTVMTAIGTMPYLAEGGVSYEIPNSALISMGQADSLRHELSYKHQLTKLDEWVNWPRSTSFKDIEPGQALLKFDSEGTISKVFADGRIAKLTTAEAGKYQSVSRIFLQDYKFKVSDAKKWKAITLGTLGSGLALGVGSAVGIARNNNSTPSKAPAVKQYHSADTTTGNK